MTTKFLDNNIFTFKILLSWRFPWKIAFGTIFPLCPPAHPPLKSANFIFIVVSLSLTLCVSSPAKTLQTRDLELPNFEGSFPSCWLYSVGYTRTSVHPYFPVAERCRVSGWVHQAIAFAIASEFRRKLPFARHFRNEDAIFALSFAQPFASASEFEFLRNAEFAAFSLRFGGKNSLANVCPERRKLTH